MTSARIAGLIAAALLAVLLVAVIVGAARNGGVVVPTNGVTAGGPVDNPAGLAGLGELEDRTRVQSWPGTVLRDSQAPSLAPTDYPPPGRQLMESWQADRDANSGILQEPRFRSGLATLPGEVSGVLVQPQGRTWREFRDSWMFYGGAIYVFALSLLIAIFLAWRGRIRTAEGESGETVRRFNAVERANHWLTATSFLLLALTGLVILYGISLIRPWLGAGSFGDLTQFSAWAHLTLAVPFVLGVIVMAVLWTRENLPERLDWNWLRQFGGFLRQDGEHPPARRFNAGQKLVFWSVLLGGLALLVTGLFLMFPFYWAGYTGMQVAQALHAALGLLMVGVIIGHIYIGTVGMQGAFDAMWSGRVDRNWAKEHHQLWYDRIESGEEPAPARTAGRARLGPAAGLATGAAVAIVLAVVMAALYREASVGSAIATARDNPSVHLEQADLMSSERAFAQRPNR